MLRTYLDLSILDQSMTDLHSFSDTWTSFSTLLLAAYIVLSSAKFANSASLIKKNKSFNKVRPKETFSFTHYPFEKHSQCHLFLHTVFFVLSMNTQKLLHLLINCNLIFSAVNSSSSRFGGFPIDLWGRSWLFFYNIYIKIIKQFNYNHFIMHFISSFYWY